MWDQPKTLRPASDFPSFTGNCQGTVNGVSSTVRANMSLQWTVSRQYLTYYIYKLNSGTHTKYSINYAPMIPTGGHCAEPLPSRDGLLQSTTFGQLLKNFQAHLKCFTPELKETSCTGNLRTKLGENFDNVIWKGTLFWIIRAC